MPASAASAAGTPASALATVVPNDKVLRHAATIALTEDCPIMLDYYSATLAGTAYIGKDKETGDKMLVKTTDEFTSTIRKLLRADGDLIVLTENSLYIIAGSTKMREISGLSY